MTLRRSLVTALVSLTCLVLLPACSRKHQRASIPKAPRSTGAPSRSTSPNTALPSRLPIGYTEQGLASWYGVPYHGRPAADGEIYDMEKLVAAHRVMPFNTWLRVTNLVNNRSVDVRVIDRGPFVEGRIIDLSKAAARQIELLGPGVGPVKLEVIAAPADVAANDFYAVQVAAFSIHENAERSRDEYAQRFGTAQLVLKQGATPLWRVLVGREASVAAAQQLAGRIRAEVKDVFVVRLDQTLPNPPAAPLGPAARGSDPPAQSLRK
jgi:rare lipoprotein A